MKKGLKITAITLCALIGTIIVLYFWFPIEMINFIDGIKTRKIDWESTNYTIDDLKNLSLKNNALDDLKETDCSDMALKEYNILLGYVENEVKVDYKIYDFFHIDSNVAIETHQAVIKIVIGDQIDSFENDEHVAYDDKRIILLSIDDDGKKVNSELVTFIMGQRWTEDLKEEFTSTFPNYHLNLWYVSFFQMNPNILTENYKDINDYKYYTENDLYYGSVYTKEDNIVNIIVPVGTDSSKAKEILEEVKPTLEKYKVSGAFIVCANDDESYAELIANEKIALNSYQFNAPGVSWCYRDMFDY